MTTTTLSNPGRNRPLDYTAVLIITITHLGGILSGVYLWYYPPAWASIATAVLLWSMVGLGITLGMHRVLSHGAARLSPWLLRVLLAFAAAAFQGPAFWWCALHVRHHRSSDTEQDPYTVLHGFWWAHLMWMFHKTEPSPREVASFQRNEVVRWQYNHYWKLAVGLSFVVPVSLSFLWGDPIGMLALTFIRLLVQSHTTWSINSIAHSFGPKVYGVSKLTARSVAWPFLWFYAILTFGEANHERHHLASDDARLGTRWYHFDIGFWVLKTLALFGIATHIVRRSEEEVRQHALRLQAGE